MTRKPPGTGLMSDNAVGVIVFEESTGTVASTFRGEWYRRVRIVFLDSQGRRQEGKYMRFGGGYLPIFEGWEFPRICRVALRKKDIVYLPDGKDANRHKPLSNDFAIVRQQ
jgi:hypothetical protein